LYLSIKCFQEYGLGIERISGRLLLSVFAAALLVGHVITTVSGRWGEILAGDFFPSKGFLFFLVSGFAYGAAIYPDLIADQGQPGGSNIGNGRVWLIAVPAWIWISLLMLMAAVYHAG
jgi:hypothetical protein